MSVDPTFTPIRGGKRIKQHEFAEQLQAKMPPSTPYVKMMGLDWAFERYINRFTVLLGGPGSGKTVEIKGTLREMAKLFRVLKHLRLFVIDPANAYYKFLLQVLPLGVPLIDISPQHESGHQWSMHLDIHDDVTNGVYHNGLMGLAGTKDSDPFWTTKGRHLSESMIKVFHDHNSPFTPRDAVMALEYPQFAPPLLAQSPRTKGSAAHDLVGKMGKGIHASASAVVKELTIAAALMDHAKKFFHFNPAVPGSFLNTNAVMYLGYNPGYQDGLAKYASALNHVLQMYVFTRGQIDNYTGIIVDEGREMYGLKIEKGVARGRQAGLFYILATQAISGLELMWGKEAISEMKELVNTLICFRCGHDSAKFFCDLVGQHEGIQTSPGENWSTSRSTAATRSSGWSGKPGVFGGYTEITHNGSHSKTTTDSTSSGESVTRALVIKDTIMPSEITNQKQADPDTDFLEAVVFNSDFGMAHIQKRFLHYFQELPQILSPEPKLRPSIQQRLCPWNREDLIRLNLDLTPEMQVAIDECS